MFEVMVTVMGQDFIDCLSYISYITYIYATRLCVDVVIIIGVIFIAPYLTDKGEDTMLNKTSQITRLGANKVGMYIEY